MQQRKIDWRERRTAWHHESESGADASACAVAKGQPLLVDALLMLGTALHKPLGQEALWVLTGANNTSVYPARHTLPEFYCWIMEPYT